MKKNGFFHFLKFFIIFLLTYNVFAVSTLYFLNTNLKNIFWQWTPYSYQQGLNYHYLLDKNTLSKKNNRLLILNFLNQNIYKNFLDIDFWNYKQIIESIDRDNIKELEKSFFKAFILSKNNTKINLELRNYFIKNHSKFSKKYKNKILKNFF